MGTMNGWLNDHYGNRSLGIAATASMNEVYQQALEQERKHKLMRESMIRDSLDTGTTKEAQPYLNKNLLLLI